MYKLASSLVLIPLALLSVGMVVVLGAASWGCYKESDLPPCPKGSTWPDPCAAGPRDAGKD